MTKSELFFLNLIYLYLAKRIADLKVMCQKRNKEHTSTNNIDLFQIIRSQIPLTSEITIIKRAYFDLFIAFVKVV